MIPARAREAGADTDDPQPAPVGAVLGPLPLWAVAAVLAALLGESLGERVPPGTDAVVLAGRSAVPALVTVLVATVVALVRYDRTGPVEASTRRGDGRTHLGVLGVVLVLLIVGPAAALRVLAAEEGLLPQLAAQGGERHLVAVVVHEPRPIASGWHVLVRVIEVEGLATRERAALTLDPEEEPPTLGSRWELRATARPLPEGGYGRWLGRQHASVVLDVRQRLPAGPPGALAAASEHVRERVRAAATRHLADRSGGLLVGFVAGDIRLLPEPDLEAMRATSLTHLTAVSGANVAIVVGGVLALLGALRIGASWRRRSIAVTVVGFAFLTRFEPSVLRAGSMALLVLLVAARGMPRDARHALAGAVLLLVLLDPRLAGSLGLLLSATATAGVLVVAPVVARRLGWLPGRLREVAGITIGAQVAVVPLLLTTFGEVPIAAVPANVIAVPAAALAAVLSFLGSLLAVVNVELGAPLFWLAGGPAHVVLGAAHGFAGVGGVAELARPMTVLALLAGCAWLLTRPRTSMSRWLVVAAVVAVATTAVPQFAGLMPQRTMTVTAIDVGQGDAFLIETPDVRILVDAGDDDTAARWLRAHGRWRLDLVVVTHPHLDHVGGVPEVLRRLRVAAVWYRPLPTPSPEAAEVLAVARERGVAVRTPVVGESTTIGDAIVEVLHPPPGRPYRWSGSELNDTSLVIRVTHDDRRVLATGDVEFAAQSDLLSTAADRLATELLIVPHHGAATSDPAFLLATGAQVGLIGVGRENRHGHPHPETLAVLEAMDLEVVRTDLHGTRRVVVPAPRAPPPSEVLAHGSWAASVTRRPPQGSGPSCPGILHPGQQLPESSTGEGHPCPSSLPSARWSRRSSSSCCSGWGSSG